MDYHLTWLYASVILAEAGYEPSMDGRLVLDNKEGIVRGNQEDVDLLVAYEEGSTTHIVIVEAKGVTGWTNKQMTSKANRLREIFGEDGGRRSSAHPHFVLASPRQSRDLTQSGWPKWMAPEGKIPWVKLTVPDNLIRVSRSDAAGTPNKDGRYWTVLPS
jgi:hypothetical protein